ncbi:MAG TPA: MFS transporter [Oleiagrimonas sp.]|nr:MFS transporter [Oleiagrimonas sp.]
MRGLIWLVAARVLQGVGGALLMPIVRYVLVRAFGPRDFVAAMSAAGIPGLLGPLLGGVLSQYASWRLIFLVNVPVGLVRAPGDRDRGSGRDGRLRLRSSGAF